MKTLVFFIGFSFYITQIFAQNPFQSIGKSGKVLTLSNGKYDEVTSYDSLQRVGSVIVNIRTQKIVKFLQVDTVYSEATLEPTIISRHWSIDPKAHEMPNWSPYSSVKCNPILYIDPDGAFPYTFHIRAFAPTGAFNSFPVGTFHDDGRGFSTSQDVTSRIKQTFTVDPTAKVFSGGKPTSDPTIWNVGGNTFSATATDQGGATANFGASITGNPSASIGAEFSGSNPLIPGAPAIAVSSAIAITENVKSGTLTVSIDINSKQFPATEGLLQDSKGNTIFLGGAAAYGSPTDLAGSDKKRVASVDLIIGINSEGIFQNVTMGGKTYTIEEFNKLGTSQPAGPFKREDAKEE